MEIASFLENIKFNPLKPAVTLLLETEFSKEIRIVFDKGQVMENHKAPFAIIVQVIKGSIDFGVNKGVNKLKTGDMISLQPNVIHNLTATEISVVRLSLSKLDTVKRVKKV